MRCAAPIIRCTLLAQEIKAIKVQQKRWTRDLEDLRQNAVGDAAAAESHAAALSARVAALEARPIAVNAPALAAAAGDRMASLAAQVLSLLRPLHILLAHLAPAQRNSLLHRYTASSNA